MGSVIEQPPTLTSSDGELTTSQLSTLFTGGAVYIQTASPYPVGDKIPDVDLDPENRQVAELSKSKDRIIPGRANGGWNQRFIIEMIEGTRKCRIAVIPEDGESKLYVTSEKATSGPESYLGVSKEGTVYTIGHNGAGHTISVKGKGGVELYWTYDVDFRGSKIVLSTWEGLLKKPQGWKFIQNWLKN